MKRSHISRCTTSVRRKKAHVEVPAAPYYDFVPLIEKEQSLQNCAKRNASGKWVIDFDSRDATLALTCAILKHHYNLRLTLPPGHLVPTIPNRVQYILWATALLDSDVLKNHLVVLDIGTGPSCIYPMLGSRMFPNWSFIGSDSDHIAVEAARQNCRQNSLSSIEVVQSESNSFFPEAILEQKPVLTLCNPPFHETLPQTKDLAGTEAQLKTSGGELTFLRNMAMESRQAGQVAWFTSLVGRKKDLPKIVAFLQSTKVRAPLVKTAELSQGGRTVRWAVAWSFGSERSSAMLLPCASSSLRYTILVKPGRKYANYLESQDIIEIACSAFDKLEWERMSETELPSDSDATFLRYRDQNSHGKAGDVEVLVDCLPKSLSGHFELLIKVNRKGAASREFLQELAKAICEKIPAILDEGNT